MKQFLILLFSVFSIAVFADVSWSKVQLQEQGDGDGFLPIGGYSLTTDPILVYYDNEMLEVYFNTTIETLIIRIESDINQDKVYFSEINPQLEKEIRIPIFNLPAGTYTIYFVRPENGACRYGTFYKE